MWSLKYEFRHSDCKYLPLAEQLQVNLFTYPINNYIKKNTLYVSALHIIIGPASNVKRYIQYLKTISVKLEQVSANIVFTLAKKKENLAYYKAMYNQFLFFPAPIAHTAHKEIGEILSWEKKHLTAVLKVMAEGKTTEHFKLLSLKEQQPQTIFLMKIAPAITEKQRAVFEYALQKGYYHYPRKIHIHHIATQFAITPSTCHEILRRAERNILSGVV